MKPEIHPTYNFVVFRDINTDFEFLTRSSIELKGNEDTVELDGETYPVVKCDITSASHPFYTGTQKLMDTEGRVEAYYRKYGFKNPEAETEASEAADGE